MSVNFTNNIYLTVSIYTIINIQLIERPLSIVKVPYQAAVMNLRRFTSRPAKCYIVTSQMNGKVLDVKNNDPNPGAKVIMYDRKAELENNQLWYEDENGVLRSKLNGFVMEAPTGNDYRF